MYHYWIFNSKPDDGIINFIELLFSTRYFRATLFFAIPFIGVFTNRKIGWILITSFFYFAFTSMVFIGKFEKFKDTNEIMNFLVYPFIDLLFIGIMNIKKVSKINYGISKNELIGKNVIAFSIGISLTIILMIIVNK